MFNSKILGKLCFCWPFRGIQFLLLTVRFRHCRRNLKDNDFNCDDKIQVLKEDKDVKWCFNGEKGNVEYDIVAIIITSYLIMLFKNTITYKLIRMPSVNLNAIITLANCQLEKRLMKFEEEKNWSFKIWSIFVVFLPIVLALPEWRLSGFQSSGLFYWSCWKKIVKSNKLSCL